VGKVRAAPSCDDAALAGGDTGQPERVYLLPGQLHASAVPCEILTIVGSCVAVCLCDAQARVGGANHYLLAQPLGHGNELRFGTAAIPRLVQALVELGARRERLEAKVFGGARIVAAAPPPGVLHLGARNVAIARELLARDGIRIVAEDVEGNHARRVLFQTGTGATQLKRLQ
jgi:chemotaxis protein CheD